MSEPPVLPAYYKIQRLAFTTPAGEDAWLDVTPWRAPGEVTVVGRPGTYRRVGIADGETWEGDSCLIAPKAPRVFDYGRSLEWKWWLYPTWVGQVQDPRTEK